MAENQKKELTEKEINEKARSDAFRRFHESKGELNPSKENFATAATVAPRMNFNPDEYQNAMSKETDPDLMIGFDIIPLPSKGIFYPNIISEVTVEYLIAKDEDLLTTPALLENGTVLDTLLKRKIKTKGIDVESMLVGDKNAVLLFLRASSYGHKYKVTVTNPYTGIPFETEVDLKKLKYKEINISPDENGWFNVEIPMRKKLVKFKLLNHKEERLITKNAESIQQSYQTNFAETGTLRLKSSIMQINDRKDRDYIHRFVDAMPALDSLTIRRKYNEVKPDVDLNYEFITPDGKLFTAPILMGIDFFFPSL